jgi:hypothetical protein
MNTWVHLSRKDYLQEGAGDPTRAQQHSDDADFQWLHLSQGGAGLLGDAGRACKAQRSIASLPRRAEMHLQNLASAAAFSVTFDGGTIPIMQSNLPLRTPGAIRRRSGAK